MTVEQHGPLPSSNFLAGREGNRVNKLVIHTMDGWIAGADARFHNPTAQVSAHFGVRVDGTLWQWVMTWDTAYHAGNWNVNLTSIGIEHEDGGDFNGVRPDALYARSAALVAQLCRENGIQCELRSRADLGTPNEAGIYRHKDVDDDPTACPDALDVERIVAMANAILTPVAPHDPPVAHPVLATVAPAVDVVHEWARVYKHEAQLAGVDPAFALAQALHETGRFAFGGEVKAEWNNPCGLRDTGGTGYATFSSKRGGVVAHLQHLLMYFTPAHVDYCLPGAELLDPRHFGHRGYPNDAHQLDGHWAIPGNGYADAIWTLVPEAQALLAAV